MGWDVLFVIWFIGGLLTFVLFCAYDLVKGPKFDGWFNLAAAIIWPVLLFGAVFDKIRRGRK